MSKFEKNDDEMTLRQLLNEALDMKVHIHNLKQTRSLINEQLADLYNELEAVRRKK